MLEAKIYTQLSTDSGVSALVSARIYPLIMPQKVTLPAVTYQRVSGGQVSSLAGYSRVEKPRIQVDCWADTYKKAKDLAQAVKEAMNGATAFTALILSDQDFFEDDPRIFRVSIDFSCTNQE